MSATAGSDDRPLEGRTIAITADRRWQEQAGLFERRGASVLHAPTMRTLDLRDDRRLQQVTERIIAEPPAVMVATTGQGMRWWLETARSWGRDGALIAALGRSEVIARGAKAASAVRAAGLEVAWRAPDETMAEIAHHLKDRDDRPATMAVQLYDPDDEGGAVSQLCELAAQVDVVPLYRWDLPADRAPVASLIDAVTRGEVDAVTFTSQPAVRNLFRMAAADGRADSLRAALDGPVLAVCVGPVCAEAGRECGLRAMHWPERTRLPAMVHLTTELLVGT